MVQMVPNKNDTYNINLSEDEKILVGYIFQKLGGSNQALISLKHLPKILDPVQLRINNVYFNFQFLNLLINYAEQNHSLNLSFDQFSSIVSELKGTFSSGHVSSSMPEPSILSSSTFETSPPVELKKRKSFLAARRRTNPFPFFSESTLISAESLGQTEFSDDLVSQDERSFDDSTLSFLPNSDPTTQPSRTPHLKNSHVLENSFSKRVSLGFEAYLNNVPTTTSDKAVRRVASELSRKLACEKGIYSNMVQDAKTQIINLESNNVQLKEQIKDLSKTIWQLQESKRAQDETFGSIEQDNIFLFEKENAYKKDIKDLKRKLLEKTASEKKAITTLEAQQSRNLDLESQITKLFESQKRLKQEKAKLLQMIAKSKKDSDRNFLESHNREQVLLEKINSLKNESLANTGLEDFNLLSVDSSDNLLPATGLESLSNITSNQIARSNSQILRKKIKSSTATLKQTKKLKAHLEKIWRLIEEAKFSLGDSQNIDLRETWEKLNMYKKETIILLTQNSIQLPSNKSQLSDNQDLNGDYHVLSARRGFLNRVTRRRGSSSARLSPKRLSLLLPQPRSNLHKVSSGMNSSEDEVVSSNNSISSASDKNNELDNFLNSDGLLFKKNSFGAPSGLMSPFHVEDKITRKTLKEASLNSVNDKLKSNLSVHMDSLNSSEKKLDITSKKDINVISISKELPLLKAESAQSDIQSSSATLLNKSQVPKSHNSIHTRCKNCGYISILAQGDTTKNISMNFSDLTGFSKKASVVSGTFIEPYIKPEIINPSTSLKTAVYLTRFIHKGVSSEADKLNIQAYDLDCKNTQDSVTGSSLENTSPNEFEIIDLLSERCAPCPASWTRDDDDFAYETSFHHRNMNPLPHQGLFLSRSGHFRVYQMGLL